MKKFGTPGLAAPGLASENVGLSLAGGCAWSSGTVVGSGVGVGTLPVSDSVFAWPVALFASSSSDDVSSVLVCVLVFVVVFFLPVDPLPDFEPGVGVAVGVAVGVGVTVTATTGGAVA